MTKLGLVNFTPITVTAETLQTLSRQKNYADLLALYMGYVEITIWQHTHSVFATTEFMMERFGWGRPRVQRTRKALIELGLVTPHRRVGDAGKIVGHYILIHHVVSEIPDENQTLDYPPGSKQHPVDNDTPNTTNYKTSTTNLQRNAPEPGKPVPAKPADALKLLNTLLAREFRVPPRGVVKTLSLFTLEEIELALKTLLADEWHAERRNELGSDYLLRPSTIDKFLGVANQRTPVPHFDEPVKSVGLNGDVRYEG